MSLAENVNAFRLWAASLGFPPETIPNEEALIKVFKSPQRELFVNLMKRVQPRQKVKDIRVKILVAKMQHFQCDVPVGSRNMLPDEMQLYLRIQDLKKRKENAELRLEEHRREYGTLAATIKTKNMLIINLEEKKKLLQARNYLLEFKSKALDDELKQEGEVKKKIIATMPVMLTKTNVSETAAMQAVQKAISELEIFYSFCENNNNSQQLQFTRDELWRKIRIIFANVPNFLIFNEIMRLKEEQLRHIMYLNKSSGDLHSSSSFGSGVSTKESLSQFDLKLLQLKADLLGVVAKYCAARNKGILLEEQFSNAYAPFVDALQKKVLLFNAGDQELLDDIISDYLVQYNLRNYNQSRNDFITQQIDVFKTEIDKDAKHLENHEVYLGTIKQVYSDISAAVNRVQYEMIQLKQIKEKILFSKNMIKHMLQKDMMQMTAPTTTHQQSILHANTTTFLSHTNFEMEVENVLCSTKLDFDATMLGASTNNSMMSRSFYTPTTLLAAGNAGRLTLPPPHLTELNTFADTPLAQLSCMPHECAFYLSPNPFVVASRELTSTIQLAPGLLLTPFGAMQEIRKRIRWAEAISEQSVKMKIDLELMMVNPLDLKQKAKQQLEHINELLDKIDGTHVKTQYVMQKIVKMYGFLLENPLRHCIPSTQRFRNKTYADCEAEFMLYYRMINK